MRPDLSQVDPLHYNLATRFTVGDVLSRSARLFGDRTAVVDPDGETSYAELDAAAAALGRGLLMSGVARQEPVAFLMGNSWRFLATFFGCAKAGIVALPVNLALPAADIAWVLGDAGVRTVVVDPEYLPLLEAALAAAPSVESVVVAGSQPPGDVAGRRVLGWDQVAVDEAPLEVFVEDRDTVHCLYTSGTTARPKGVLTSHLSVHVALMSSALQFEHRRGDEYSVFPVVLPLFHTTALDTLTLPVLLTGGTVVLQPFDAATFGELVQSRAATHIMLLPMMYDALLANPDLLTYDLTSVRLAIYAMAPMAPERIEKIAALFPNAKVLLGSGQTECVPTAIFQFPSHQHTKPASWGAAVVTVDAEIMGPDGAMMPTGQTGEIVYRGPHVMTGYWNNSAANASAFERGWLHSGDLGHLDDGGVVWFTDRAKDIVKSGGENVSSVEVERALLGSSEVLEAAVVGLPDDRWGEAVTAVVVAVDPDVDPEALAARLLAYCKGRLAGFQVPKRIDVVNGLPKTATGKIQKAELRGALRHNLPSRSGEPQP